MARLFRKTGTRNRRELADLTRSIVRTLEPPKNAEGKSFDALWMLENL
jgi:hypothetical protein